VSAVPGLTASAARHLAGRGVVLRLGVRHGCCGGRALLPVAEVGPPDEPDRYVRRTGGGTTWYVDPRLRDDVRGWTVDAVGIGRWRRLHLAGAEGLGGPAGVTPRT
jgi:hypothetical protein